MPTELLLPGRDVAVQYGGSRRGRVDLRVEASGPVDVYVTTPLGLQAYENGQGITEAYRFAHGVHYLELAVLVPPHTPWWLVIVNRDIRNTFEGVRAVHYEVFTR